MEDVEIEFVILEYGYRGIVALPFVLRIRLFTGFKGPYIENKLVNFTQGSSP